MRTPVPAAFGVDRDAGREQRLDVAQHGAGGHLQLASQRGRGQPTSLAQQHQRDQPVGAHAGALSEYMTEDVVICWEARSHDVNDGGYRRAEGVRTLDEPNRADVAME